MEETTVKRQKEESTRKVSEIGRVIIKPVKVYKRGETMIGVTVMPGAKKTLCPYPDGRGSLVTGHTPEMNKAYNFDTVDASYWRNYRMVLTDTQKILSLEREQDLLAYRFLKAHEQVANSESEIDNKSIYVMYNEEARANEKLIAVEKKAKAFAYISSMSEVDRAKFLKLFGYKTKSMSPTLVFSALTDMAESSAKVDNLLKAFDDKFKETKILIESLVQSEILTKKATSYYFGEELLGANLDFTVAWFEDPKNQEQKIQLIKMLEEKDNF